ncbi:MAG: ABC transporter substrate-binding protein [Vicinamibacterales bacterium]
MDRQSRALLTLLLVAAILIPGWWVWRSLQPATPEAPAQAADAPPQRGGTLVATMRQEPRSFNRFAVQDFAADLVATLTQGRLVRVNRATGEVEPWLAESWQTGSDGRTFTLTLRDGVTWSDGVPFTADDVLFSFEALYDPAAQSVLGSSMRIDGDPLTVTAPDTRTVIVSFPHVFGPGIRLLDNLTILPRHVLGPTLQDGTFKDAWSAATPPADIVGTGPFVLARYDAGQRLVFERNPRYWRKDADGTQLPYLDSLVLEIVPDQNAELVRLQAGQSDMVGRELRAEDIAVLRPLERQGQLQIIELGVTTDPDSFFFNLKPAKWEGDTRRAWLPTEAFRQAISHAVDREAFANTVFLGAAVPIHGPVTPGNTRWFDPNKPRYEYSPEKARALLSSLGLENRDDDEWLEDAAGTEARFSVLTFRGNTVLERSVAFLADDLRQVGIAVDVVPLEQGALIQQMLGGTFESIFFNFSASDLDPAMSKDLWVSNGGAHVWNIGQETPATPWEAEIDRLMAEQASTLDYEQRKQLFDQVQTIFAEHLPIINFAAPRLYMGVSARVTHLTPSILRPQLLWSADTIAVAPGGAATP